MAVECQVWGNTPESAQRMRALAGHVLRVAEAQHKLWLQHAMHNSRVVNCKANALQKPKQDGGHLQVVEVQSCKVFGLATFEHFGSGCTGTG